METIIVSPKTKAQFKLLTDLLHELKIPAKVLTDKEKKDFGLGMNKTESDKEVNEECQLDHTPNARTLKTFRDTEKGIGLTRSKNANDLFKKLGI